MEYSHKIIVYLMWTVMIQCTDCWRHFRVREGLPTWFTHTLLLVQLYMSTHVHTLAEKPLNFIFYLNCSYVQ